MSIEVRWFDESYDVLYYRFEDPWTAEELVLAIDNARALADNVSLPSYIIYDMRHARQVAKHVLSLRSFVQRRFEPQVSVRVVVGASGTVQVFLNILKKFLPVEDDVFVLVETLDDAIAHIQQRP